MAMRQAGDSFWALDRQSGKEVLVTPEIRQLYSNSIRYIRLHSKPVPQETQEIIKITEEQISNGIKQSDFTKEQVEMAQQNLKGRFYQRGESKAKSLPPELENPPTEPTAAPTSQVSPDEVQLAPADPEPKAPKKKAATKKAAKK